MVVADDEAPIRAIVVAKMRAAGFTVHEARDGEEALELVLKHRPDLVITDLQMPFMDGLSLCLALREHAESATTPAVLLTARSHLADEGKLARTNIRRVIGKPFSAREIVQTAEEILATENPGRAAA